MATIKLVQGDNLPFVKLSLTNKEGLPIDLSSETTSVVIYFRAAGSKTVIQTIGCGKLDSGYAGGVIFNFPGDSLNIPPGPYEGEIEVNFDGDKQTIFKPLKFLVREQFA